MVRDGGAQATQAHSTLYTRCERTTQDGALRKWAFSQLSRSRALATVNLPLSPLPLSPSPQADRLLSIFTREIVRFMSLGGRERELGGLAYTRSLSLSLSRRVRARPTTLRRRRRKSRTSPRAALSRERATRLIERSPGKA